MILSSTKLGVLFAILVFLFPFVYEVLGWYDEMLVVLCAVLYFSKRGKNISRQDKQIFVLIILLGVLGAISNIHSRLVSNISSNLIDYFGLYKTFLVFIFCRELFDEKAVRSFVNLLLPICKLYLIICVITGLLSQFVDLGMTIEDKRYGIKPFGFLFLNNVFPATILIAFMIIRFSNLKERSIKMYLGLLTICLILQTKGTFLIFVAFLAFYYFYLKKRGKFKTKYLIIFLPIILYLFSYQIDTYISNTESVRMILILNGIKTAYDYFPLGSGFSTYGTNEAAVHYSPLYYKYGFDGMWKMGPEDGAFLNDGYIAGIIGEEGFIGFFLFIMLVVVMCRTIFSYQQCTLDQKAVIIGVLLCLLASMTATGIFKGVSGVFMMSVISIFTNKNMHKNECKRKTESKQNIIYRR